MRKMQMRSLKTTPMGALLAGALLGLIVMPLGLAAAKGPTATSAGAKKQIRILAGRIAALEAKTSRAGGDLTGTYPNPTIAPDAVGSLEVIPQSLDASDLGNGSVRSAEIEDFTVQGSDMAFGTITSDELAGGAVRGPDLGAITQRSGSSGVVATGQSAQSNAVCQGNERVLSGGGQWSGNLNENKGIQASYIAGNGWVVQGKNQTGGDRTLSAFVNCLQA